MNIGTAGDEIIDAYSAWSFDEFLQTTDRLDIPEDDGDIFGLADRTYRVSGDTSVERVCEAFDVLIQSSDPGESFDTIGGLIAHEMGHVPRRGEQLLLGGLQFVVLHTKGGAVRWFKVSKAEDGSAAA